LKRSSADQRTVRADDGHALAFSGWSELFAVLQTLTSGPGDDAQVEEGSVNG